jgi:hypothetical protein
MLMMGEKICANLLVSSLKNNTKVLPLYPIPWLARIRFAISTVVFATGTCDWLTDGGGTVSSHLISPQSLIRSHVPK